MKKLFLTHIIKLLIVLLPLTSVAQDKDVFIRSLANVNEDNDKKTEGWTSKIKFSVNTSFGQSNNVIGQDDGNTVNLGININSDLNYLKGQHSWDNSLNISESAVRTPTIPKYVKSSDEIKYLTVYRYAFKDKPWLGPYARASAQTSMFTGEAVTSEPNVYSIDSHSKADEVRTETTLYLTDPFHPLTIKESVGLFARAVNKKSFHLMFRAGFGVQQVSADGQLTLQDDKDTTDTIEVVELRSYTQLGTELGIDLKGVIDEKTSYFVGLEVLTPWMNSLEPDNNRNAIYLTNFDFVAKLTSKIYSWVSLDYELKLKNQPQLFNQIQTSQYLVLNFNYSVY